MRIGRRLARALWLAGLLLAALLAVSVLLFAPPTLRLRIVPSPALTPSIAAGLAVFALGLLGASLVEQRRLEAVWRWRTSVRAGLPAIAAGRDAGMRRASRKDFLEWACGPLLRSSPGQRLTSDWSDAGFGDKGSRYLLWLLASATIAAALGLRIAGPILSLAGIGVALLVGVRSVRGRAMTARRQLEQQLPQALDAIAAALAAGLSLPQAIHFAARDLPSPVRQVMAWLDLRLRLGRSIEQSLTQVVQVYPDPSLSFALDGVAVQRAFGGNLVMMLHQTSALLRERAEIEREVQAATSQGKLSGWIVAALVPVSAAILLVTNPRYIDVLFHTLVGQILLVVAIGLLLAGWLVISRLIRVRY
jgi:tight adherence protein B